MFICAYSFGFTKEKIFELLADIEEKLFRILERKKEMDSDAQEELYDYIERTVAFYSNSGQELIHDRIFE